MYEYSDTSGTADKWYSLHMMQTINPAMNYLSQIRAWMDAHPTEIVVMWFSKHGSVCDTGNEAYPKVPVDVKQAYWAQIEQLFSGVLLNTQESRINETSIADMIARSHRAVAFVSDYKEFTGSSKYALDACLIDNQLGPGMTAEPDAFTWETNVFQTAAATKAEDKKKQSLFLVSMAAGAPTMQYVAGARIR
jgi:hypothetical protein